MEKHLGFFSLMVGLGATVGLWCLYRASLQHHTLRLVGIGAWTLLGAWFGGWTGYVLMHLTFFTTHTNEIFRFWQGGLNGVGAFVGGILFAILAALVLGERIPFILDKMTHLLYPLAIFTWLGCLGTGVGYGAQLPYGTWWGLETLDEAGVYALRFPLQLAAAVCLFLTVLMLDKWFSSSKPGNHFVTYCLLFSMQMVLFTLFRADPLREMLGLRLDILMSLFLFIVFLVLWSGFQLAAFMNRDKMELKSRQLKENQ